MSPTSHALQPAHVRLWIVMRTWRAGHSGERHSRPRLAGRSRRGAAALVLLLAAGPDLVAGSDLASARPRPKAEPAPPVRAYPEMGDGFVRLPGSDTCVKLGGSVRVEFMKQGGGAADR